jgi:uncharacterized protein (TIGR02246 family)
MTPEHIGADRRARSRPQRVGWLAMLALAGSCASPPSPPAAADVAAIEALLTTQAEAWNRGDLHAFVAGYSESPRMTFVGSGGTITRGRAALEARYRAAYPTGQEGRLSFDELEVRRVGPDAYVVLGRWALARPPDHPNGRFTLVLERGTNGLEIIHDHSSDAD